MAAFGNQQVMCACHQRAPKQSIGRNRKADKRACLPGIIIELKVLNEKIAEDRIEAELEKTAQNALDQIERKQYVSAMRQEGLFQFFKIGAAFYKKHVKLMSQTES